MHFFIVQSDQLYCRVRMSLELVFQNVNYIYFCHLRLCARKQECSP